MDLVGFTILATWRQARVMTHFHLRMRWGRRGRQAPLTFDTPHYGSPRHEQIQYKLRISNGVVKIDWNALQARTKTLSDFQPNPKGQVRLSHRSCEMHGNLVAFFRVKWEKPRTATQGEPWSIWVLRWCCSTHLFLFPFTTQLNVVVLVEYQIHSRHGHIYIYIYTCYIFIYRHRVCLVLHPYFILLHHFHLYQ